MLKTFWANRNRDQLDPPKPSVSSRTVKADSTSSSRAPPSAPVSKKAKTSGGKGGGKIKGAGGKARAGGGRTANNNTNNSAGTKRKAVSDDEPDEDEPRYSQTHVDGISKYEDIMDWEPLVETVDTIVNNARGQLLVYLTM